MEFSFAIASNFEAVDHAVKRAVDFLIHQCHIPTENLIFNVKFCLRELLNNAVEHGNRFCAKYVVKCQLMYTAGEICIVVWDNGTGFDLQDTLQSDILDSITRERTRGLSTLACMGWKLRTDRRFVEARIRTVQ